MIDHAHIEAEEDARERAFQGLDPKADLTKDHIAVDPLAEHAHAPGEGPDDSASQQPGTTPQAGEEAAENQTPPPRQRVMAGAQPNRIRDADVRSELDEAKRSGGAEGRYDGHKPRSPEERLRAGVPYSELKSLLYCLIARADHAEYK